MGMSPEARDPANLWDLLTSLEALQRLAAAESYESMLNHQLVRPAVERAVTLIGAAASRISLTLREQHPEIPWGYLAELGRRTREEYNHVDYRELWRLVEATASHIEAVRPLVPPVPDPVDPASLETRADGSRVAVKPRDIGDFCRRWHIRNLWLFGSVVGSDFRPDSDIDVLVEFEEGRTPGLAFFDAQNELQQLFGRDVDLLTAPSLQNPFVRQEILRTRRLAYAA